MYPIIFRSRKSKYRRNTFPFMSSPSTEISSGSVYSVDRQLPNKFAIELRDKNFDLKARVEHLVTSLRWDWNRVGGCGRASLRIKVDYASFNVSADDDVRVYLPDEGGTSATLWYRGYVESVAPRVSAGEDSIDVECIGYFGWMERIIAHNAGSPLTYTSTEVSEIVKDLVDDFIVANTDITRGTVDGSTFSPDTLSFKTTVKEALDTLSDLLGDVEYGVDANLVFFWYNQSNVLSHRLFLGDKVTMMENRASFRDIINQIYLEGGRNGDDVYLASGSSDDSQTRYGKHEVIMSNGSITTAAVAAQYISGVLRQKSKPQRPATVTLINTNKRFETTLPIGAVGVIDPTTNQSGAVYGTVANGGDGKVYGSKVNNGSGQMYGGSRKDQIDRITYTLSPEDGRVDASLVFGGSEDISRASALLKRLEFTQDALRQRSL